jgi:NAD(P)H-dependent flavin oxidoreductase YrpB (nitropropane dioxygenase family)
MNERFLSPKTNHASFGVTPSSPAAESLLRDTKGRSMSSIATRFTERFGLRYPFACAGMAFAATEDLALAVCRGGGVGAIGVGLIPAEELRATIRRVRQQTTAPFNINFLTIFDNDARVRVCAEERVPIVSFHWGHPSTEHIKLLRDADVSVWEQIGSVDAAKKARADGIEVIVAQGWEAGGHNYGGVPTLALVPLVVDAVGPSLVLAAGGIADGRGAAAALALGADGVWVGSRMVATREAAVHPEHKRRIVAANGEQAVLSSIFGPEMPQFNPMRVIRNRVVDEWNDRLRKCQLGAINCRKSAGRVFWIRTGCCANSTPCWQQPTPKPIGRKCPGLAGRESVSSMIFRRQPMLSKR